LASPFNKAALNRVHFKRLLDFVLL